MEPKTSGGSAIIFIWLWKACHSFPIFSKKDNELGHNMQEICDKIKTSILKLSGKKGLGLEVKAQNLFSAIVAENFPSLEKEMNG